MKLMTIPIRFLLPIRPDLGRTSVRASLLACLPVFALLAVGPVHAATLTVCPSGCDFTAIQPAVDSALSGDTIRISSGVFPGFVSITDKSLVLQGEGASRTVIDGSLDDPSAGVSIVTLSCSQSFQITIQDLAITNTHPAHPDQAGLDNSGCKLELKNSTVTGHSGVAILHRGDTLSIEDSVVAHNGLGISVSSGTGTLMRSTVSSNATRGAGGGVYIGESCTLRVHLSTISNNRAVDGGGIFNSGELTLIGSSIMGNYAAHDGGGIFNEGGTVSETDTLMINNHPNDCVGC